MTIGIALEAMCSRWQSHSQPKSLKDGMGQKLVSPPPTTSADLGHPSLLDSGEKKTSLLMFELLHF